VASTKLKNGVASTKVKKRARQNVIFELGFFIGKFGTDRVAALIKGNVEKPSDFAGIGYISLDPHGGWKWKLAGRSRVRLTLAQPLRDTLLMNRHQRKDFHTIDGPRSDLEGLLFPDQ